MNLPAGIVIGSIVLLLALVGGGTSAQSSVTTASKARGTLVVAVDAPNAPYALAPSDGQLIEGLDADLARAVANVLGYRVVVVDTSPNAIFPGVVSGKYDVGILFERPGPRLLDVDLVGYLSTGSSFYVAARGPSIRSLASLCGRSVAVARATAQAEAAAAASAWCKRTGKARVKLLFTRNAKAAEAALASGRVQVAMADTPVAAGAVKRSNGRFRLSGATDSGSGHVMAISSENGLSNEVVDALEGLIADGTYASILDKWGAQAAAVPRPTLTAGAA